MLEAALFPRKLASNFLLFAFCISFYVWSGSKSGSTIGTGTGTRTGTGTGCTVCELRRQKVVPAVPVPQHWVNVDLIQNVPRGKNMDTGGMNTGRYHNFPTIKYCHKKKFFQGKNINLYFPSCHILTPNTQVVKMNQFYHGPWGKSCRHSHTGEKNIKYFPQSDFELY